MEPELMQTMEMAMDAERRPAEAWSGSDRYKVQKARGRVQVR